MLWAEFLEKILSLQPRLLFIKPDSFGNKEKE